MQVGVVLCNIYRKVPLYRIQIGRKRRKKFLEAYAKLASKFVMVNDLYAEKIAGCAEVLYRALEKTNSLDLIDNTDDCACAIFFLSGLKELGSEPNRVAAAFEANLPEVQVLLSHVITEHDNEMVNKQKEKADEID